MNETMMTIAGNVVDNPRLRRTASGHAVASFRVASTPRRFDREKGQWVDAPTLFVTVSVWRGMAENVSQSLVKGQPVLVTGRYCQREYTVDEQPRTSYELEATSVGHDLARGVSRFERVTRSQTPQVELDEHGVPADLSEHVHDFVEEPAVEEGARGLATVG